jgi:uncharacterized cupredoxin-like copper-binding protein
MHARASVFAAVSVVALVVSAVASAQVAKHATAQVTVTFTDTTLRVAPQNPEAGTTTFLVVNKGKKLHTLVISGPGVKSAHSAKIKPGASAKLTVKLQPGAYELSDPVGLGAYNVQFLDIVPATKVSSTGDTDVVTTAPPLPPMCGQSYTP